MVLGRVSDQRGHLRHHGEAATVWMAAYGDYATGYIGTEIAYSQGGYELQASSSNTSPQVEKVLMAAMHHLLE